jgi:hypothetical protein
LICVTFCFVFVGVGEFHSSTKLKVIIIN